MSSIGTLFDGRPWRVRVSPLVRYIDNRKYVDEFFATGRLQLSTWRACWEAEDAERRDWSEGRYEGMVGTCATAVFAPPALLLCVSAVESVEVARAFKAEAGIRIIRPLEFAHAIARTLISSDTEFEGGDLGPCVYRDDKFDEHRAKVPSFDESRPEESIAAIEQCVNRTALRNLFVKDLVFRHQAEWRFVWWVRTVQASRWIIECPESTEFCEPVTFR